MILCRFFDIWYLLLAVLIVGTSGFVSTGREALILPLQKRYGKRLVRDSRSLKSYPIVAENDGVWYSKIHIGTPPQIFTAIVDTGSGTIAVPCAGCSCGNHNHFSSARSPTAQTVGRYSQCYGEGSCNRGSKVSDMICLGETCSISESVRHSFGCCTTYASAFKSQEADGIIGISGSSGTLIADLRTHHKLTQDVFGICLGLKSRGFISIGSVENDKNLDLVSWTPMHRSGSFYIAGVSGVYVGGNDVFHGSHIPSVTIDSGTSYTYIPFSTHSKIKETYRSYCDSSANHCKGRRNPSGGSGADIRDSVYCAAPPSGQTMEQVMSSYPSISFRLEGGNVDLCIPPEQYFFLSGSTPRMYCVGFFKDRDFVFGANLMSNFNVIFEHSSNRMGWVRADCESKGPSGVPCCGGPCTSNVPTSSVTSKAPSSNTLASTTTKAPTQGVVTTTQTNTIGSTTPSTNGDRASTSTTNMPSVVVTTTSRNSIKHHEQELKKEFEVTPNSNDQGYSLKMKTKSISQFALWNHDILYIDKSEFTSEICVVKDSKEEQDISSCHLAAGSHVIVEQNIHAKFGSIDIFNLELKTNSVVFTDENSSFTVKGILKSSGTIHVSSGAAFTIGDFIAASSLSNLVFHHKTKLSCLSNGKVDIMQGNLEIRGHMQTWCALYFNGNSSLTVLSAGLLSSSSGTLLFSPKSIINFFYGPSLGRFGIVSVAGDATLNGNLNIGVQMEANDKDVEKYPFEIYSLIKGVSMNGNFASINIDKTFQCLNSSVIINLVSASIAFQQSCFMECWEGSGVMTKACLAGPSNDNLQEPVENNKKIEHADALILTLLIASGSLILILFVVCCIFHCCPCNICKCCQPRSQKYTNLEKTDVDEIELVDVENDI